MHPAQRTSGVGLARVGLAGAAKHAPGKGDKHSPSGGEWGIMG